MRYFAQFFLSIGMSRHEYWYENVYIVEEYIGAYKLRRQEQNWFAWLSGIYTFDSVSAVIGNIHFDKGAHTPVTPMKEPIRIFPLTPEEEEAERQRKIDEFVRGLNDLHARMEIKNNARQHN